LISFATNAVKTETYKDFRKHVARWLPLKKYRQLGNSRVEIMSRRKKTRTIKGMDGELGISPIQVEVYDEKVL
jgi:hypothetical protein